MPLYSDLFYRLALTPTIWLQNTYSFTIVTIVLCLPSSSFRPWVPDLNLSKSHVKRSIQVLLALKILFQLSIHSQRILFTHSRMQPTCDKILKHSIIYLYMMKLL